ncbi:glutamate--tRNA ligase [Patescibacteria group bacterium]|nr:glutamate--tRNA ligase [Patescibacteria group bacterium]
MRVRYAPSPTGELHLGSLRTVIFDWLTARGAQDGVFIVRIEDTDQSRLVPGATERLLEAMRWMGITPDEGVYLDENGKLAEKGEYGPYIQSQRLSIYREQADRLVEDGHAYRCFCTPERLEQMRAEQQANHLPPRYDRQCRSLTREESDRRAAAGEPYVIRHAIPDSGEVRFVDLIRGEITFQVAILDDYVLLKSDGFPTYQLASVVDDHFMKISCVLRGEEWIPSLPKNILLYQAFGWDPPAFAHVPVILGPDGKHKLSKRDGDVAVLDYQEKGYLPEALCNVLAFLGWSPGTEEEFFSREELADRFRLEKVQKSPAVFSFERLDFVNGWYIRHLPITKFLEYLYPRWEKAELMEAGKLAHEIILPDNLDRYLMAVAGAVQERMKHFDETEALTHFFLRRPEVTPELVELIIPKKSDRAEILTMYAQTVEVLQNIGKNWTTEGLEEAVYAYIEENGYKKGEVLWPIRAALTGEPASPGAFEMLSVLGREESLVRLQSVLEVI